MSMVPPPNQPAPLNYAQPARNNLREIAVRQRAVILCILGYIVLVALQFALPPGLRLVLLLAGIAVSITATVFVFMLSIALYNTGLGVVLGLLTLIPFVGLIVLLIVNGKATGVLRANGVRVGFLGASPSQFPTNPPIL